MAPLTSSSLGSSSRTLSHLYAVRIARIAAGFTLFAGALVVIAVALAPYASFDPLARLASTTKFRDWATYALVGAWGSAIAVYVLAYLPARWLLPSLVRNALAGERTPDLPISALTRMKARTMIERLERPSYTIFLSAIALMSPLLVHFLIIAAVQPIDEHEFGRWIILSLAIVGHAHLIYAGLTWRFAHLLTALPTPVLESGMRAPSTIAPVLWAALAALIPGAVALFIPPIVVLFTGLALVPILVVSKWVLRSERLALERSSLPPRDDQSESTFHWLEALATAECGVDDIRQLALKTLTERFPAQLVTPVLDRLVRSISPRVRATALESALELHHRIDVDALLRAVRSENPLLRRLAAESLRWHKDERLEAVLIPLTEDRANDVAIAAIQALGGVGTIAAVEPLFLLTSSHKSTQVRAEAREAVERIQLRLGPRERGRVSIIAPSERGALALAPAERGALSEPRDP